MKIAVILPKFYKGSVQKNFINVVCMIQTAASAEGVQIVAGLPSTNSDIRKDFSSLRKIAVEIREFSWGKATRSEIQNAMYYQGRSCELPYDEYSVPEDGVSGFCDCAYWLLVTDRTDLPLAPIRPYGVLTYGYMQRYVPSIFEGASLSYDDSFIATARMADTVFYTNPETLEDVIQYCGINKDQTCLLPIGFNPYRVIPGQNKRRQPYFIWPTNTTQHKNHSVILDSFDIYYKQLNGKLDAVVAGAWTNWFDPDTRLAEEKNDKSLDTFVAYQPCVRYVKEIRKRIVSSKKLKSHLCFLGFLQEFDYVTMLSHARFLLHGAVCDNGSCSVIEAAHYNVPSLSSDYPQMRFLDNKMQLNMMFFSRNNPWDLAEKLHAMESLSAKDSAKNTLPDRSFLEKFSCNKIAGPFWEALRERIYTSISSSNGQGL